MTQARPCAAYLDAASPPTTPSLLGGAADLCDAFFHVRATAEAGLPLCCLRHPDAECEGRNTVIVARLQRAGDASPCFVARFHNSGKWAHAERVMMDDARLGRALRHLDDAPRGTDSAADEAASRAVLTVYISLQPCHHSSSTPRISCTEDLVDWFTHELSPRRVELELAIAYPYRSHWRTANMERAEVLELGGRALWGPSFHSKGNAADRSRVAEAIQSISSTAEEEAIAQAEALMRAARDGTCLLCASAPQGFRSRGFCPDDWAYLLTLCDDAVREAWEQGAPPFTKERLWLRRHADEWTERLLDGYRGGVRSPSLPPMAALPPELVGLEAV